jgi:5-bromo-4-chloroindolyl phosphate hydrolysis protein
MDRYNRYTYSILPSVSLVPRFRRFDSNRCAVTSMNRMMSNHSCLRSHLGRINIVENLFCIYLGDYETIDHECRVAKNMTLKGGNFGMT